MARRAVAAGEAEELRGRIEQWRLTRTRQGQMPEELWLEAAEAQALDRLEQPGEVTRRVAMAPPVAPVCPAPP